MDLSKLDQNDRTAAIASAVLIIAGLFAATTYVTYGITWLAILAGVGMLFVVLQPQIASGVNLPGSKGSLMLILGGIAGVIMVLALLTTLGFIFVSFGIADILYLVAIAAAVVMAWTGWQAFQAEGGKFQLGTSGRAASTATAPPEPSPAAAAPEATPVAPPAPEPVTSAPPEPPAADPSEPATDRDADA
jgi:predicted lipid-binding transport protein (Tim44 family)